MFKKKKYKDSELITLVKEGNSDKALNYLYKTLQPKVTAWILQNSGDKEEAQDVFQDSIIVFYRYVLNNKFKIDNSVEAFIFSIAKNKWINRVKLKNKTVRIEGGVNDRALDEEYVISEDVSSLALISNLLEQLGEVCKDLLTYSIFYKLSMEDIALKMGYENEDTAKTKKYKCKQRLVKLVKDKKGLKSILYDE